MDDAIPVYILAGGKATRLGGHATQPKALLEVAGRPFLVHVLEALRREGLTRITLLTGHQAHAFEQFLDPHQNPEVGRLLEGLTVRCLPEAEPLGTGGALRRIAAEAGETVLVLNGDSYVALEYRRLLAFQAAHDGAVTLAAVRVAEAADYGGLEIDAQGRLTGFREKGLRGPGWINAGVYALPARFLREAVPPGVSSLECDLLPAWLRHAPVWVRQVDGYFCDIGTPERLARARAEFPPPGIEA